MQTNNSLWYLIWYRTHKLLVPDSKFRLPSSFLSELQWTGDDLSVRLVIITTVLHPWNTSKLFSLDIIKFYRREDHVDDLQIKFTIQMLSSSMICWTYHIFISLIIFIITTLLKLVKLIITVYHLEYKKITKKEKKIT